MLQKVWWKRLMNMMMTGLLHCVYYNYTKCYITKRTVYSLQRIPRNDQLCCLWKRQWCKSFVYRRAYVFSHSVNCTPLFQPLCHCSVLSQTLILHYHSSNTIIYSVSVLINNISVCVVCVYIYIYRSAASVIIACLSGVHHQRKLEFHHTCNMQIQPMCVVVIMYRSTPVLILHKNATHSNSPQDLKPAVS